MGATKNFAAIAILLVAFLPLAARAVVVISSDPTQNMNCQSGVCAPIQKDAVLNAGDLMNLLGSGNLTVTTQYKVGSHARFAGAIVISVPINWATPNTLDLATFDTNNQINAPLTIMGSGALTVQQPVKINSSITVMGAGALAFQGGFDLTFNGQITFWDLSAQLVVGVTPVTLVGDVPTLASDIAAAGGTGYFALANDYDAKNDSFRKAPIPDFKGTLTGLGHTISNLTIKNGRFDCEGLVSKNEGSISSLRLQNANVSSATLKYVGALVGCNNGSIYNVVVDGTVSGSGNADVGAIAGGNYGSIYLVHTDASISGGQAGGIVGENGDDLVDAYAEGTVIGVSNAGGLVGANKDHVQESYATASVNGNGGAAGGLAGFNSADIADCYSIGAVSGTGYVGGFVGYDPNESVSNGYWDLDTSGMSQGVGFPFGDPGPVGLTTAQLQSRLPPGFSRRVWQRDANINNGFPYLRYLPPQ